MVLPFIISSSIAKQSHEVFTLPAPMPALARSVPSLARSPGVRVDAQTSLANVTLTLTDRNVACRFSRLPEPFTSHVLRFALR